MKKMIAASILALLATGGSMTIAKADPPQSGFGNYGLCNAYYQGSEQGQAKKREHSAAFKALYASAEEWAEENDYEGEDVVRGYCDESFPKPGGGNTNAAGKKG